MGAALVVAWAGGAGIASATEDPSPEAGCEAPLPVAVDTDSANTGVETDTDTEGDPISPEPCDTGVTVVVVPSGDCDDPETFTFLVNATGLEGGVTYTLLVGSEDIVTAPSAPPVFIEDIKADDQGTILDYEFTETEGAAFTAPDTGLTFGYALTQGYDTEEGAFVGFGEAGLEACEVETEPVVPVEPTHPTTPAPSAAPVVVTHPAAAAPAVAAPAVLANTGSPVTTAALLGGGLLVVGAGALVATRRRAS